MVLEDASLGYQSKKNKKIVIHNLTLRIEDGECLAILGPSGCGKSTLVNALAGMLPFESGGAFYEKDGQKEILSPKLHRIGVIPQGSGLLPWKTVRGNCLLPLKIRKEDRDKECIKELEEISKALHIEELLDRYPGSLSGGQAQRAAIARAFLRKPDLLLMDEPFSSLDAITAEEAKKLYLSLWEKYRVTGLLVTHNIEEALYLGNRIGVMSRERGSIEYLKDNPYFGSVVKSNAEYDKTKDNLMKHLL